MAWIEGADFAVHLVAGADREDLLDGALTDENVLTVLAPKHDREAPADEVERDLVDLVVLVRVVKRLAEVDML
jgi:hypothetical protein